MELGTVPPKELLQALYAKHVNRYGNRLQLAEQGRPGFNKPVLERLLAVWRRVEEKEFDYEKLSPEEKSEVNDAIHDEKPN